MGCTKFVALMLVSMMIGAVIGFGLLVIVSRLVAGS